MGFKSRKNKGKGKRLTKRIRRRLTKRIRKRLTKRRTLKGGMFQEEEVVFTKRKPDSDAISGEKFKKALSREEIKEIEETELHKSETELPSLENRKLECRKGDDTSCNISGPDFLKSPEMEALQKYAKKLEDTAKKSKSATQSKKATQLKKEIKKSFQEEITKRIGLVRSKEGPYIIHTFPMYNEELTLEEDIRIKFVVIKVNGKFIILMAYANMLNYHYVEEFLKKWTAKNADGTIRIRNTPKEVFLITPQVIKDIERFCRVRGFELEWNSLLWTKTVNPDYYQHIINEYLVSIGKSPENTVAVTSIEEISHSALPINYKQQHSEEEIAIATDEITMIPSVYLGCEGVFYRNRRGKLCFIICNISGHYQTPKERMAILRLILKYNYGYEADDDEIRVLFPEPEPPSSDSDSNSQSSTGSSEQRDDYRSILTNDPDITGFIDALEKLNGASTTPVVGPTKVPFSLQGF